jgi:hypothetical protein
MPTLTSSRTQKPNPFTQADLSLRSISTSRLLKIIPAIVAILTSLADEENQSDSYRLKEANRRLVLLGSFTALLEKGTTKTEAARLLGVSTPTMWRWSVAFEKRGFLGLLPHTDKCGRKPKRQAPRSKGNQP